MKKLLLTIAFALLLSSWAFAEDDGGCGDDTDTGTTDTGTTDTGSTDTGSTDTGGGDTE